MHERREGEEDKWGVSKSNKCCNLCSESFTTINIRESLKMHIIHFVLSNNLAQNGKRENPWIFPLFDVP